MKYQSKEQFDIILIGAGIMSATLGCLFKELNSKLSIGIFEKLPGVGLESSHVTNNAGTGHTAYCELNYTPYNKEGDIDISKALDIAEDYLTSKIFWSYLIRENKINNASEFINPIAHCSFVHTEEGKKFLYDRYQKLKQHHFFEKINYSDQLNELQHWFPLITDNRNKKSVFAATKIEIGTDVNFGALTNKMINYLLTFDDVQLFLEHEIIDMEQTNEKPWLIESEFKGEKETYKGNFIFIGSGGGALPLIDKSGIPEGEGYGGFPVSGQFLVCQNEAIVNQHNAKVYGKAAVGAPPMSVPHLDTRYINGKRSLLFGPFAGFSTKFLKYGSYFDLPNSIELSNFIPMISAGIKNYDLTKYLIQQVSLSHHERMNELRKFVPTAKDEDWILETAGQRVQIIKKDKNKGGILKFGTEIIAAQDGSIAALLGASPGASTAVAIMLDIIKKCFKKEVNSYEWKKTLKNIFPNYDIDLKSENNKILFKTLEDQSNKLLQIN